VQLEWFWDLTVNMGDTRKSYQHEVSDDTDCNHAKDGFTQAASSGEVCRPLGKEGLETTG
jgi:hypothetical protein